VYLDNDFFAGPETSQET